jgi:cytoskeletal protein CcmA (bactofilin family)
MWGSSKKFNSAKINTLIGRQTAISGDVYFTGGLHVEGKITGNVTSEADPKSILIISENGVIEGDVNVPNMVLNGTVAGDVYVSERLELAPRASVTGNVYYNLLEMTVGAQVNGNLVHRMDDKPKLEYKVAQSGNDLGPIQSEVVRAGSDS